MDDENNKSLSEICPVSFEEFEFKLNFTNNTDVDTTNGGDDDNSDDDGSDTTPVLMSNLFDIYSKRDHKNKYYTVRDQRRAYHGVVNTEAMKNQEDTCAMMEEARKKIQENTDKRALSNEARIENMKKKRRLLKELKVFTGVPKEDEHKTRGWSEKASIALMDIRDAIIEDMKHGKYKCWDSLYKQLVTLEKDIDAMVKTPKKQEKPDLKRFLLEL